MSAATGFPLSISDLTPASASDLLASWGISGAHAVPLLRRAWYFGDDDPFSATELGQRARALLGERLLVCAAQLVERRQSEDGVVKLLLGLADGQRIETALIPVGPGGRTRPAIAACLSTQVGCAVGCRFCASGLEGLSRHLSAGEIVAQYQWAQREARAQGAVLRTIVLMGIGEPLHNLANVVEAVRRITDPQSGGFGRDHLTLGTVGDAAKIRALAGAGLGIHLAISVHAGDDALRRALIPTTTERIAALLDAGAEFRERTRKFVTLAYAMIEDVNDAPEQARTLAAHIAGRPFHVNLIPVNPVAGLPYRAPSPERLRAFFGVLRDHRVVVHVRRPRGDAIAAACGQLRRGGRPTPPLTTLPSS